MSYAPVILFVYRRPEHTCLTVEALQRNELASRSELFIYSDGAKNGQDKAKVNEVREYIKIIDGFKKVTVIEREKNYGLANNIIDGVTKTVDEHGKVIVLEDDLVTNPYFLRFMNRGLEMYKNEHKVASIHGFVYPIEGLSETFFLRGADCWGWATWSRAWSFFEKDGEKLLTSLKEKNLTYEFDFSGSFRFTNMLKSQIAGKNDSWAIRWYASAFLNDMLTLYPGQSLVKNIGYDIGTHCNDCDDNLAFGRLSNFNGEFIKIPIESSEFEYMEYSKSLKSFKNPLWKRIINKVVWLIEGRR